MEKLLTRNLAWLNELAHLYYKNKADAEDLASETVLRLWQAKDRYDEKHAFRSLAYKVMQNIYINQLNRRKRVIFVDSGHLPLKGTFAQDGTDSPVLSRQIVETVRKEAQKSVCIRPVIMYAIGYSYQEIAEMTKVPLGTVQRRIHDGRKNLERVLTA